MTKPVSSGEVKIYIRSSEGFGEAFPVPARIFKKSFNSTLSALKAADKFRRSVPPHPRGACEFVISDLDMGSNIFGISGFRDSVEIFHSHARDVYQSDFSRASQSESLASAIIDFGHMFESGYEIVARFEADEIPIDKFFVEQCDRLRSYMTIERASLKKKYYTGTSIVSFSGIIGEIDYRKAIWSGRLLLHGGNSQIECVFDRSKGEDAYNMFGFKRVSVTGRAIYTGESQLPGRLEVISIQQLPVAKEYKDIKGSVKASQFRSWSRQH